MHGSPPGFHPWDSPGKNTGVGCHFLLRCMKVKSESEVAQSCPTLRNPMDCSLPGSSVHGFSQARVLEWVAIAFSVFDCTFHQRACLPFPTPPRDLDWNLFPLRIDFVMRPSSQIRAILWGAGGLNARERTLNCSKKFLMLFLRDICLQCGRHGFDPWVRKIPW